MLKKNLFKKSGRNSALNFRACAWVFLEENNIENIYRVINSMHKKRKI